MLLRLYFNVKPVYIFSSEWYHCLHKQGFRDDDLISVLWRRTRSRPSFTTLALSYRSSKESRCAIGNRLPEKLRLTTRLPFFKTLDELDGTSGSCASRSQVQYRSVGPPLRSAASHQRRGLDLRPTRSEDETEIGSCFCCALLLSYLAPECGFQNGTSIGDHWLEQFRFWIAQVAEPSI
jgi:hypothetical protein